MLKKKKKNCRRAAKGNTDLLEHFAPHVLCPVRCNWSEQKSLTFNISKNDITMHASACSKGRFTIAIPGTGEIIEAGLQSQLEVGTKKNRLD